MAKNGSGISVSIDKKKKTLTITMPLEKPRASASGKTMVVASTRGNKVADGDTYEGNELTVGCNVYYKD